jgi:DNA-binding transcriptional ArsR family regulator
VGCLPSQRVGRERCPAFDRERAAVAGDFEGAVPAEVCGQHPVRLRVLQTLAGTGPLTTSQLRDRLPDIPQATLYRHIAVLADAEVLEVADERRVRGAVERSYRLRRENAVLDPATMTLEDHRRAFTMFSTTLMADFDRYLAHEKADPATDGVVYRQVAVWLTDEESAALVKEIYAAFAARAASTPGGERIRRYFSLIAMPDESSPGTL